MFVPKTKPLDIGSLVDSFTKTPGHVAGLILTTVVLILLR